MKTTGEDRISAAIDDLYHEHRQQLIRLALGIVGEPNAAEDVVQTSFAKLVERASTVRADARRAWLFRTVANEAITRTRREAVRRRGQDTIAAISNQRQQHTPYELAEQQETIERAKTTINHLPKQQRQVLLMRIVEGKTFRCIADELEIPRGTALSRMQAALKNLRKEFNES